MDGTLYDSMGGHTAAWQRMMTELGVATERDEFYLYEGMTGAATINLLFQRQFGRNASDDEITELYGRKTRYFKEIDKGTIMPGAPEMLKSLKECDVECILVTGSGQRSLIDRIASDFPGVFSPDKMITARDVDNGKPHPEPYLRAMKLAGALPAECIVIENAPLGVQAGAASGAFTVGITTGPVPVRNLKDAGADIIYRSMPEFAADVNHLITRLNRQL